MADLAAIWKSTSEISNFGYDVTVSAVALRPVTPLGLRVSMGGGDYNEEANHQRIGSPLRPVHCSKKKCVIIGSVFDARANEEQVQDTRSDPVPGDLEIPS
ncbi:hypothetical protein EVAR_64873_1 [Eumeta japonica]|uniref:Uncharacterized protein n=1 Tax=Eumeta variegata TaxID=151549 RepID=A0A4C1ZME7_EUMVA|nr:hypothetical protein EVAR_64873_1 [Eumeta japonica]